MKNSTFISKSLYKQHDQSDCGVACLLTIIKYYGGTSTIESLRRLSGTTRNGTTLLGLHQAAKAVGFESQGYDANIKDIMNHGHPLILHILSEAHLEHYVVCFGHNRKNFIIGDPAKGILSYSEETLNLIWQSRKCLTLKPNKNFKKSKIIKSLKRKWFLEMIKPDYMLLLTSIGLGVVVSILGTAMAIFSQKLIDDILPSKDLNRLIAGIGLLSFLLLVRIGLSSLRTYLLIRQSKDFNERINNKFYSSLLHLPNPFFYTRKIGDLVARLNDTNRIQRVVQRIADSFVIDGLTVLVSIIFLFYYSFEAGIISLVSIPIYFTIIFYFNKSVLKHQEEVMQKYAQTQSNYISSIRGIKDIKNNNKQDIFKTLNKHTFGGFQKSIFGLGRLNIYLGLWGGVSSVIFLVVILVYTSYEVLTDNMMLGELMAILAISGMLLPSIVNLALISIPLNEGKIAFFRMFEFASLKHESSGKHSIKDLKNLIIKRGSYRFAGRGLLLKDLNIFLEKGRITALVGESGSGKSTIGEIIQKSYLLENGDIFANDNLNLKDINLESWRKISGIVSQEINIFPGNIIDNILLGEQIDPELVVEFCKENGFDEFIKKYPQGYLTILGEEGINLSGGQLQIVALIRALFLKPKLLILDEATSSMDSETEIFTLKLLKRLSNDMIILFISHRLHLLKDFANEIYVLEEGRIVNSGGHNLLMESNNIYSRFWHKILEPF